MGELSESHITVVNMAGDSLELDAQDMRFVSDLKSRIDAAWQVPPIFQKLLAGAEILDDACELGAKYDADKTPLTVTMLVSVDALADVPERYHLLNVNVKMTPEMLEDTELVKAIKALQSLDMVMVQALRGSRPALSIIDACLLHSERSVQRIAWHVLDQRFVHISHCDLMASIIRLLAYHGAGGRCLGAVMFGKILKDEEVELSLEEALDELEDKETEVMEKVAPILTQQSVNRITKIVAAFLDDPSPDVSCSMLEVLPNLFEKNFFDEHGRHHIISRLLVLMEDSDASVKFRCSFLKVLPELIIHGFGIEDGKAIILRSLVDQESAVRLAAVQASAKVRVDDRFLPAFTPILQDPQVLIRSYAVQALQSFSQKKYYSYDQILEALLPCLVDGSAFVRYEVTQALGVIAHKGDANVIAFALPRLQHASAGVRRSAVDAIAAVSDGTDPDSLPALRALSNDEDSSVRYGVELALNLLEELRVQLRIL